MKKIKIQSYPKEDGYVESLEDNLIVNLTKSQIADYNRGQGGELKWKIVPHFDKGYIDVEHPKMFSRMSSSALVVNAFAAAAAKKSPAEYWNRLFNIGTYMSGGVDAACFEKQLHIDGVMGWSPNLDFFVRSGKDVLAVESKYTEPLSGHAKPKMQEQYFKSFLYRSECADLLELARDIISGKNEMSFKHLDAIQLVKHLLGLESLIRRPRTRIKRYKLIYLYHPIVDENTQGLHKKEAELFCKRLLSLGVPFKYMTYRDLCDNMSRCELDAQHLEAFKMRYRDIRI